MKTCTRFLSTWLVIVLSIQAVSGQEFIERTLQTQISDVTMFPSSAQVFESGEIQLPAGRHVLIVRSLSPYIDDKSIQVSGDGEFTILSVHHKLD